MTTTGYSTSEVARFASPEVLGCAWFTLPLCDILRSVQRPAIQAHAYGCAFIASGSVGTKIPQTDVLRGVVVGVVLLVALLTGKRFTVAIVWVCKSTVRAIA